MPQSKHNSPITDSDSSSQESSEDCTAEEETGEYKCPDSIAALQRKDQQFTKMIAFMETGELPDDQKFAKRIVMEHTQ